MTVFVVLALVLFLVGGIGMAITRAYWSACCAFGLACLALSELWPHLGLH